MVWVRAHFIDVRVTDWKFDAMREKWREGSGNWREEMSGCG